MVSVGTKSAIRITRPTPIRKASGIIKAAAPVVAGTASALGYFLLTAAPNSLTLAACAVVGAAIGGIGSLVAALGVRNQEYKQAISELTANGSALRSRGAKQQALITSHEKEKLVVLKEARKKERTALVNIIEGFRTRMEELVKGINKTITFANYYLPEEHKIEWRPEADPNAPQVAYIIGEGGMGRADRVYEPLLQRFITRKLVKLPEGLSAKEEANLLNRAREEAMITTRLRHPNIVEAYTAGIDTATNLPFIEMEFLEGESAADYLERKGGKLTLEPAAWILYAVMKGLRYAHSEGVIHRDIKPENVFILAEGELHELDRVKIIDFGIAKGKGFRPTKTQAGFMAGITIYYGAPEQLMAKEDVDGRADIYAAGATFYEMLTGRPPLLVEGKTADDELSGAEVGDLTTKILSEKPEPMSMFVKDVPAEVDALVLKMLEKDPNDRPGYEEIFKIMGEILEPSN